MMTNIRKRNTSDILKLILAIVFISPLFICIVFSFVPDEKLYAVPTIQTVVNNLTFKNYNKVFETIPIVNYVKNSLIVCCIVIVVQLLISCMAAYAFAFLKFHFKDFWFTVILIAMMVPGQMCLITNYLTVRSLGLMNTYLGLTIVSFAGGRSLFMMRQSFLSMPKEMREAAMMDGCGEIQYMIRFAIPLSLPSVSSVCILLFIGEFNAYMWPLLVARKKSMFTIQIGMEQMISDSTPTYGMMMAVAVLSLFVPIVAFVFGRKYMVAGMTAGAVKG